MNKVDQRRLNRIRLSRGLAVRELARDTGISISVLNRLETSTDPTLSTISVAEFARLADRLGVHVGDLFTNTTDTTTSGPADEPDVQRLGALLLDLKHATPIVVLADALGWTLDRVHRAATALSGTLAPSGLTMFHAGGCSPSALPATPTTRRCCTSRATPAPRRASGSSPPLVPESSSG